MGRSLPEVLADILALEGALLEGTEDGGLEFVVPPSLSKTLGIPEHGKLSFAYSPFDENVINASYESEFFRSVERLFLEQGKATKAVYSSHLPNIEKVSRWASEGIALSNASFRLQKAESQRISYALIFLKYVALSDEKREGVFSLLVNEQNLSTSPFDTNSVPFWENLREPEEILPRSEGIPRALQAGLRAASLIAREEFEPFIDSLKRRLNRDIKRVFEYYETLKAEARKTFEKKIFSARDSHQKLSEEETKVLSEKLDAIEREKKWKIQDLVSKYALNIRIDPVCLIDIETDSLGFPLEIRRRLSSRSLSLYYNPLLKRMDPLPCESCFYPRGAYYVCDERLHILCSSCFRRCQDCGREYCPVCHPAGCPKCKHREHGKDSTEART